MNLHRSLVTSIAAIALFSAGSFSVINNQNATVVEAKSTSKKLAHTAAVYTAAGRRTRKLIKKGRNVKVIGYKTIKGVKYAHIGKNSYVKIGNLVTSRKKSTKKVTKKTRKAAKKARKSSKKKTTKKLSFEDQWEAKYGTGVILTAKRNTVDPYGKKIAAGSKIYLPDARLSLNYEKGTNGWGWRECIYTNDATEGEPHVEDYTESLDSAYSQAAKIYKHVKDYAGYGDGEPAYSAKTIQITQAYKLPTGSSDDIEWLDNIEDTDQIQTIPSNSKLITIKNGKIFNFVDGPYNHLVGIAKGQNGNYYLVFAKYDADNDEFEEAIAIPAKDLTWVKNNN